MRILFMTLLLSFSAGPVLAQGQGFWQRQCKKEERLVSTCYEYKDVSLEQVQRYYPRGSLVQVIELLLPFKVLRTYEVQRFDHNDIPLPLETQTREEVGVKKFQVSSTEGDEASLYAEIQRELLGSEFAFRCTSHQKGGQ